MSQKTYRAAVIGLGMIGGADQESADKLGQSVAKMDGTHTGAYMKNPRVKIVAGATRDQGRRERYEKRTGAKTYADWREMIDKEQIDIVSVATYSPTHAEITIGCAQKGIPVIYCEKPVATKLTDAEKMLDAAERNKSLLLFNHQRRTDPNHRRLQQAIAEGQLGDLVSATVQWSTGRLGNVGTHVIDGLIMLTKRRIQAVSATLDLSGRPDCRGSEFHDPGAFGTLKLEGGMMAAIHAPDYAKIPGFHTEIYGKQGRAIIKGLSVTLESADGKIDTWAAPTDGITSMDRAVSEIIDQLDGKKPFSISPEESVHVFETIVGFHASHARNGAWTNIPLTGKDREIEVHTG